MRDLELHEFKNRCLSASLLKHEIGLSEHYGALLCEELGLPAPEGPLSAQALVDLAEEALKARSSSGASSFKAAQKAAKKASKAESKKTESKKTEALKEIDAADVFDKASGVTLPVTPLEGTQDDLRGALEHGVIIDEVAHFEPPAKDVTAEKDSSKSSEEDDDITKFI